jgi:hypothetical protein
VGWELGRNWSDLLQIWCGGSWHSTDFRTPLLLIPTPPVQSLLTNKVPTLSFVVMPYLYNVSRLANNVTSRVITCYDCFG